MDTCLKRTTNFGSSRFLVKPSWNYPYSGHSLSKNLCKADRKCCNKVNINFYKADKPNFSILSQIKDCSYLFSSIHVTKNKMLNINQSILNKSFRNLDTSKNILNFGNLLYDQVIILEGFYQSITFERFHHLG